MNLNTNDLLTVAQYAKQTGVTKQRIGKLIALHDARIKVVNVGNRIFIRNTSTFINKKNGRKFGMEIHQANLNGKKK